MLSQKPMIDLIKSIENSFDKILLVLKSMGNEKRLKILVLLLTGEKTFETLKKELGIQKTALSNHLTMLINGSLVEKPNYGVYKLSDDGKLFLQTIEAGYSESNMGRKEKLQSIQKRQFSESFVDSLLKKNEKKHWGDPGNIKKKN